MSGIWLGCAIFAGVALGLPAVAAAIVVGAIHWAFRAWRAPLAIALILAAALGAYRGDGWPGRGDRDVLVRASALRGVVSERPKVRGGSQSLVFSVQTARVGNDWVPAAGRLAVTSPIEPQLFAGDEIFFSSQVRRIEDLIGEDRAYVRSLNGDGAATAWRVIVERRGSGVVYEIQRIASGISHRLQKSVPGDAGILLSGLVMGDDTRLSPARRDAFVNTGTTHITAVSGSNFALIVVILTWVGRTSGTRRRFWFQLGALALLLAYAALVGFGPPAVRAVIVASAALIALRFGRRPDFVTLIVLAAALDLLVRPDDISRLSFQLSTASALALSLVLAGRDAHGFSRGVAAAILATFAAQLATIPFLLQVFPRLSLASIPANALIALPTSLAFFIAMLASVFLPVWPMGGEAIAAVAGLFARIVIGIVDSLGSERFVTRVPLEGSAGAIWITTCCMVAIALMSHDIQVSANVVRRRLVAADRTIALAAAGAIAGAVIGVLAWSLH